MSCRLHKGPLSRAFLGFRSQSADSSTSHFARAKYFARNDSEWKTDAALKGPLFYEHRSSLTLPRTADSSELKLLGMTSGQNFEIS